MVSYLDQTRAYQVKFAIKKMFSENLGKAIQTSAENMDLAGHKGLLAGPGHVQTRIQNHEATKLVLAHFHHPNRRNIWSHCNIPFVNGAFLC